MVPDMTWYEKLVSLLQEKFPDHEVTWENNPDYLILSIYKGDEKIESMKYSQELIKDLKVICGLLPYEELSKLIYIKLSYSVLGIDPDDWWEANRLHWMVKGFIKHLDNPLEIDSIIRGYTKRLWGKYEGDLDDEKNFLIEMNEKYEDGRFCP